MSQIFVSTQNSTTTPLGALESFTGASDILASFQEVDINLAGLPLVAPGTLYFEFSPDDINWDTSVALPMGGPNSIPLILRVVLPYFRVRYVNGAIPLQSLRLTTLLHRQSSIRLTRFLSQDIDPNEPIEVVRVAKSLLPDGAAQEHVTAISPHAVRLTDGSDFLDPRDTRPLTAGDVVTANAYLMGNSGQQIGINTAPVVVTPPPYGLSAFGEVRTAAIYTLEDLVNKYNLDPNKYGTSTSTGGAVTHVPLKSAINLSITDTDGSRSRIRTHTYYRYQAGKGMLMKLSAIHADTGQTNQTRRWGMFDDNDGVFWVLNNTTLGVAKRSSVSGVSEDLVISQSNWNVDKLDGSGPSEVVLDITKGNIYEIQIQWLGVGSVKFFVDGILAHHISNQNLLSEPYMRTAQLPIQCEMVNTGASVGSNMTYICATVIAEGGEDPPSHSFASYNSSDITTSTERPLLSIRPKTTFNSIENRMLILPTLASVSTEGGRAGWRIVVGGTLTGASFSSVDSQSGVEFDVAATALTGGQTIHRGFLPNSNDRDLVYLKDLFQFRGQGRKLRQDAFATSVDTFTIMGVCEQPGNTSMRASVSWDEIR